ncbi:MerR family transcriptional regulator [Fructilactobacillus frigidiflavus]|uniref:MerR family transcriptional regulator n=1 Tax=Fructilactobacillus frigidiflavus TaxID=3242688 RepID=UPI003756D174
MNIKEASEISGVSADTIRYYERIGLIPPIKRNQNGVRKIDDEDLRWIKFSRQMRNAGISVEALIEYLALFRDGETTIPARLELLNEQKAVLAEKIEAQKQALDRLDYKINNYQTHMKDAEASLRPFQAKG